MSKTFRIYEGHSFKLTPEQEQSIGEAICLVHQADLMGRPGVLLAQVWVAEDGCYCCCNFVDEAKATIIKQVLSAGNMVSVRIDTKEPRP